MTLWAVRRSDEKGLRMRKCLRSQTFRFLVVVLIWLFATAAVVFAQKQPAAAESGFVSWKAPVEGNTSGYAGTEACVHCHQVLGEQLAKTVHTRADVTGTSTNTSCEACHGPGKAHADAELEAERTDTKNPEAKKLIFRFYCSPQENSARCLSCHRTSKEHDLFDRSEHKLQAVSCDQCHAPHLVFGEGARETAEPSLPQAQFSGSP